MSENDFENEGSHENMRRGAEDAARDLAALANLTSPEPQSLLYGDDFQVHGTPEQVAALFGAIARARAGFREIERTKSVEIVKKDGGKYTYTYAELGEVLDACTPSLSAQGVSCTFPTSRAAAGEDDLCTLRMIVAHEAGGLLVSVVRFYFGSDIKDYGSRLTYMQRYAFSKFFNVYSDSDEDEAPTRKDEASASSRSTRDQRREPAPPPRQAAPAQQPARQPAAAAKPAQRPQEPEQPPPVGELPARQAAPASKPVTPTKPSAAALPEPEVALGVDVPADVRAMDDGALLNHLRELAVSLAYSREVFKAKLQGWFGESADGLSKLTRGQRNEVAVMLRAAHTTRLNEQTGAVGVP